MRRLQSENSDKEHQSIWGVHGALSVPGYALVCFLIAGGLSFGCGAESESTPSLCSGDAMSNMDACAPPSEEVLCGDEGCDAFCDPFVLQCTGCLVTGHCSEGEFCMGGSCIPEQTCGNETPCEQGLCDPENAVCIQCLTDEQCGEDGLCIEGGCLGPAPSCSVSDTCPEGLVCHPLYGRCLPCGDDSQCGTGERCGKGGVCVARECNAGEKRCSEDGLMTCRENGTFGNPDPCPVGQACNGGACVTMTCTPGGSTCEDLQLRYCNSVGTPGALQPCPPGNYCPDGEDACVPIRHRVVLMMDTSGSMGRYPGTNVLIDDCAKNNMTCPQPWPVCERAEDPLSILAISKGVFSEALSDESIRARVDFAMMRFPQTIRDYHTCRKGHYKGQNGIQGDTGAHVAPASGPGWFRSGMEQTLCVPFPDKEFGDNFDELLSWVDSEESLVSTGVSCNNDGACGYGFCDKEGSGASYKCMTHDNPEIRGSGYTPIGKSLFYAGEYFRQDIFVEGRNCSTESDCASPGYQCVDGRCEDPIRHCRKNVILLFSDGTESIHMDPDDYFHPWVQAKRFSYGLGCETNSDCLGGASCLSGVCMVPGMQAEQFACSNTGNECQPGDDCGQNGARCASTTLMNTDPQGGDLLKDAQGRAIRLMVHAVDIDVEDVGNAWIAKMGGGNHYTVGSSDTENFLSTILLVTDIKQEEPCVAYEEEVESVSTGKSAKDQLP